jgi:hypothetical protein
MDECAQAEALYRYITPALTCGRVPTFGSAEWVELDEDDPAKQAAVVRAALVGWTVELDRQHTHLEASHAVAAAYIPRRR